MAEALAKNPFYMKKLMRECKVRDTSNDGFIARDDFEIIIQRYKDMGYSDQHIKVLSERYEKYMEVLGIADPNAKLTYEQVITNFLKASNHVEVLEKLIDGHFAIIDGNGDGEVSFTEWVDSHKAMGIDTAHAKASFAAMDKNGDGAVSKEEFMAYNKEFYVSTEDTLNSSILFGPLD